MKLIGGHAIKCALVFLPMALCCGCNDGRSTRVVMGRITYQGKPIPFGRILLMPNAETEAPPAGTYISDGQYRIDGKGGVTFGTYKVEITGYSSKPNTRTQAPADQNFEGGQDQYIPPQYNVQSKMELVVELGSGPLVRDFELQ